MSPADPARVETKQVACLRRQLRWEAGVNADAAPRWDVLMGEMIFRRTALAEAARGRGFAPSIPGARASDGDIAAAEARLGHPLDQHHAAILREGDGYDDVFAFGDLLSTSDLGHGPRWAKGRELLRSFYEPGRLAGAPPHESIYPIHVGDEDIFVIDMAGPVADGGHPVYWLTDQVIDSWRNIDEYWLAGMTLLDKLTVHMETEA